MKMTCGFILVCASVRKQSFGSLLWSKANPQTCWRSKLKIYSVCLSTHTASLVLIVWSVYTSEFLLTGTENPAWTTCYSRDHRLELLVGDESRFKVYYSATTWAKLNKMNPFGGWKPQSCYVLCVPRFTWRLVELAHCPAVLCLLHTWL